MTDQTVVVVSHDRAFLDIVCTDIIHFYKRQLHYYPGNFSDFQRIKSENDLRMQRVEESVEASRKHIKESIARMEKAAGGPKGDHKKQVSADRYHHDKFARCTVDGYDSDHDIMMIVTMIITASYLGVHFLASFKIRV